MEGTSGVKKTKEGNSLLWGVFPGGCPVRPPWVCCVGSRFGPFGCGGFVPATHLPHLNNNTTTQPLLQLRIRHQPDLAYSTLQLFFPSHPPYNSNYITDTRGLGPRACLISYHENPSYSLHQKEGNEKAYHPNHIGLGISLRVTKEIIPITRE